MQVWLSLIESCVKEVRTKEKEPLVTLMKLKWHNIELMCICTSVCTSHKTQRILGQMCSVDKPDRKLACNKGKRKSLDDRLLGLT